MFHSVLVLSKRLGINNYIVYTDVLEKRSRSAGMYNDEKLDNRTPIFGTMYYKDVVFV